MKIKLKDGGTVNVHCAFDKMVALKDMKRNPRNPNTHPVKQIEMLAKIIKENGFRRVITVSNRTGLMVAGHGRLDASEILGCEKVPVDYQDYESEEHEIADMLADNQIPELAEIDEELQKSHLAFLEAADFDLEVAGFFESTEQPDPDEKDLSVNEVYVVEISVNTELEQRDLYDEMNRRGLKCRVLKL